MTMDREIREWFEYDAPGGYDQMDGWLSVIIRDECNIEVYVQPVSAHFYSKGELLTEGHKNALANGTEFIFRARCKNRDEAEKVARAVIDIISRPGLICFDLETVREIAVSGNHEAKAWLFESFDNEPLEEFKTRIKAALPPLTSFNYILHVEGDIGLGEAYDIHLLIPDVLSKKTNVLLSAHYNENPPGYKAFYVFAFESDDNPT